MEAARSYHGPLPHWIVAERQTAARGRQGRVWLAADGAFSGTLLIDPNAPAQQAAWRSFVAACALHEALSQFVAPALLAHKWPNDVLLDGGKVAGILLEAQGNGDQVNRLHVGIGVNLGHAPKGVVDAAFPPMGVADVVGTPISATEFLPVLAQSFARFEYQCATQGFAPIRNAWMAHAARLGEPITARTAKETLTGRFDGIDDDGNLMLLTNGGVRAIPAADVYF